MTRISLLHCKNRPCNNSTAFAFLILTQIKTYVSNSMKIDSISQLLIRNITFFFQKMPLAISIALSQYIGAIFKPF